MTPEPPRSRHRHPRYRRIAGTLVVAACMGIGPAPALGQGPLPENNAGTGEYVEPVPDPGGDRRADPGGPGHTQNPLPGHTRDALPPGEEGRTLERLATDSGSGAQRAGSGGKGGNRRAVAEKDVSALSAVRSAAFDSDGSGILFVVLVLGALTLAAAVVVVRRRRRS